MTAQAPGAVVLVRPHRFRPNPVTLHDNAFQARAPAVHPAALARGAHDEVTALARALTAAGVGVHLFEDEGEERPDSVFPNNWLSTHTGGRVALHPMSAPNRRQERRADVVEVLKARYLVEQVVDYSGLEHDGVFLEGTGAMVLDHVARVAYVARSGRVDATALQRFCRDFDYEAVSFDAVDDAGRAIYHTNVMMCVATDFVLVGLDLLPSTRARRQVAERITRSGRALVELTAAQVGEFAGNAIELQGRDGRVLAISARGLRSLDPGQRRRIEATASLLPVEVPTVELAGGSVRCMIAGIHLRARSTPPMTTPAHEEVRTSRAVGAPWRVRVEVVEHGGEARAEK